MKRDESIRNLLKEYQSYDASQSIDKAMDIRKRVSLWIYKIGEEIKDLEEKHKNIYAEIKLKKAFYTLDSKETTGADRANDAIKRLEEEIKKEATMDGTLRGLKIQWESLKEISNSIATYLK